MAVYDRKKIAIKVVRLAGEYLNGVFEKRIKSSIKSEDSSWVSEADLKSEELMIKAIGAACPYDGILSEESAEIRAKNNYRWILDPLDGTHNFLMGNYDFGCGLALEDAGKLVLGVCYFPKYNHFYWAEKGKGAFCNNEQIFVSNAKKMKGEIFYPDSNFRVAQAESLEDIKNLTKAGCSIRINGCSHRALTFLASGRALVVISRSGRPWDTSPATIIVREAGGMATDENGDIWHPNSKELVATNGFVHEQVLSLIGDKS